MLTVRELCFKKYNCNQPNVHCDINTLSDLSARVPVQVNLVSGSQQPCFRITSMRRCSAMCKRSAYCGHGVFEDYQLTQRTCAADLQPADVTLEAVEAVLFQVCDGMKGMIKPGKTLVRETIRWVAISTEIRFL